MDRHDHYENLSKYFSSQARKGIPVYILRFDDYYLACDPFAIAKIPQDKANIVFYDRKLFPKLPIGEEMECNIARGTTRDIIKDKIISLWSNALIDVQKDELEITDWILNMGNTYSLLFKDVNSDKVRLVNAGTVKLFITKDSPMTHYRYYTDLDDSRMMLIVKDYNALGVVPISEINNVAFKQFPLLFSIRETLLKNVVDTCLDCMLNPKILLEDRAT